MKRGIPEVMVRAVISLHERCKDKGKSSARDVRGV